MKSLLLSAAIIGLTASASFAIEPVQLTNEQMDGVNAGALLNVFLVDVADVNDVNVAIPINAAAAVAALCGACPPVATATQRGRQR